MQSGRITYKITKHADINDEVEVVVIVTSVPVPEVQQIAITSRVSDMNVNLTQNSKVITKNLKFRFQVMAIGFKHNFYA